MKQSKLGDEVDAYFDNKPVKTRVLIESPRTVCSLSSELARACVEHLQSSCTCSKEYLDRKRTDPDCEWCNTGKFILPLAERLLV